QQQSPLEPLAEERRPDRGEQHEEVDLELARSKRDRDLLHREPGPEDIRDHEEAAREDRGGARLLEAPADARQRAARQAEDELGALAERPAMLMLVLFVLSRRCSWRRRLVIRDDAGLGRDREERPSTRLRRVELHVEATRA